MANGQQLTPLDTQDLGGQLLQALVQGHQTKMDREQIALRKKALDLQQQEQQANLASQLTPDLASGIIGSLLGQTVQPSQIKLPIAEQEYNAQRDWETKNPDKAEISRRIKAYGSPLDPAGLQQAAEIASGMKMSAGQRGTFVGDVLTHFGSPYAKAWNQSIGHEIGAPIPLGAPSLEEQKLKIDKTQAEKYGAAADAARINAELQARRFVAQGFRPVPGSPAEKDPELAGRLADEYQQYMMGKSNYISSEASQQMLPTEDWARVVKASADIDPRLQAKIDYTKSLLDHVNQSKGKIDPQLHDLLLENMLSIQEELYPTPEGASSPTPVAAPEGNAAGRAFSWALDRVLGNHGTATLSGRPLRPELQMLLDELNRAASPAAMLGGAANLKLSEMGLQALQQAYEKVLPLITTDPSKPPELPKTLGPLSDPKLAVGNDARQKLQTIVAAYRAAGFSAEETKQLESDLSELLTPGPDGKLTDQDMKDFNSTLQEVLGEIETKKKEQK